VSQLLETPTYETCGRLAHVHGHDILFSPALRAIFKFSGHAAEIWRLLEGGEPPAAIALTIARSYDLDPLEAARHVTILLKECEKLGLVRPSRPLSTALSDKPVTQLLAIAGIHIRIVYPAGFSHPTIGVFRHLEVRADTDGILIEVTEQEGCIRVFREGNWKLSCSLDELATALKSIVLSEVLNQASFELAVHAAALLRNDRMLLLCGHPGAGKTTLTMALASGAFKFAADDVALLDESANCIALPFAPAIKSGAWPIVAGYCPDLKGTAVFRRPDRKRVRYPVPKEFVSNSPHPVGWVLLLHRTLHADCSLELVDPADSLRSLLSGAFARGNELTSTGFCALTKLIENAVVFRLTYSRLTDAVDMIVKTCR
jgi:hypothetical protein